MQLIETEGQGPAIEAGRLTATLPPTLSLPHGGGAKRKVRASDFTTGGSA